MMTPEGIKLGFAPGNGPAIADPYINVTATAASAFGPFEATGWGGLMVRFQLVGFTVPSGAELVIEWYGSEADARAGTNPVWWHRMTTRRFSGTQATSEVFGPVPVAGTWFSVFLLRSGAPSPTVNIYIVPLRASSVRPNYDDLAIATGPVLWDTTTAGVAIAAGGNATRYFGHVTDCEAILTLVTDSPAFSFNVESVSYDGTHIGYPAMEFQAGLAAGFHAFRYALNIPPYATNIALSNNDVALRTFFGSVIAAP